MVFRCVFDHDMDRVHEQAYVEIVCGREIYGS